VSYVLLRLEVWHAVALFIMFHFLYEEIHVGSFTKTRAKCFKLNNKVNSGVKKSVKYLKSLEYFFVFNSHLLHFLVCDFMLVAARVWGVCRGK
jgi:hypothetical protein